ncbi:uncharacterized protein Tco_1281269 [Tanacetum coccineum]
MFMGHRRSLLSNHPYRGMSSEFDGHSEYGRVRTRLSGDTALSQVSNLNTVFGKGKGRQIEQGTLMGLLLNILGKTKDGINARKDMVSWGIRLKLAPVENDKKCTYLPPACYTMSKAEKTQFCKCLHDIKVPSGYSVNIRSLVSMKDYKLQGMKSHDCHVLMAHMIPIVIRVIDPEVLDSWQRDIIITLCQLEMYFPPSFFDVMVHLVSHSVSEIKACGPIHLRNMFPFERYMGVMMGLHGVGTVGSKHSSPNHKLFEIAHFVVLEHMTCVSPYIQEHMEMLCTENIGRTDTWYTKRHNE